MMEERENKVLANAFGNSLTEDAIGCLGNYVELGIDSILEDGVFKDIPIVSTVISIFKVGNSIRERQSIKKLIVFLNEIYAGASNTEKLEKYKEKFNSKDKFQNQQIEYLLVLIDRYISYDKPKMLAKLYMAYLDGEIIWNELTMYAEAIDRFLIIDADTLFSANETITIHRNIGGESVLRLVALGLMSDITNMFLDDETNNEKGQMSWKMVLNMQTVDKTYARTEFGEKLAKILSER